MRYALTALLLTVLYVALVVVDAPTAAEVGGFYLGAVAILVMAARVQGRRDARPR